MASTLKVRKLYIFPLKYTILDQNRPKALIELWVALKEIADCLTYLCIMTLALGLSDLGALPPSKAYKVSK